MSLPNGTSLHVMALAGCISVLDIQSDKQTDSDTVRHAMVKPVTIAKLFTISVMPQTLIH